MLDYYTSWRRVRSKTVYSAVILLHYYTSWTWRRVRSKTVYSAVILLHYYTSWTWRRVRSKIVYSAVILLHYYTSWTWRRVRRKTVYSYQDSTSDPGTWPLWTSAATSYNYFRFYPHPPFYTHISGRQTN